MRTVPVTIPITLPTPMPRNQLTFLKKRRDIMKKKVLSILLSAVMAAGVLAGCGSSDSGTAATTADNGAAAEKTATADAAPAGDASNGKVYYLNFKPEADEAWQKLAEAYTAETGVPVTVVTAASGQYETTLQAEMAKSDAPTLFQVNGPVGLKNWVDYCYDLAGSDIVSNLTSDAFALKSEDGATVGIAYVIESYGICVIKNG